jgi:hypothetical protein
LAANSSLANFDQKGVNCHEPFDKSIFHCIHKGLTSCVNPNFPGWVAGLSVRVLLTT